jgi:hypothetical protein
MADKQKAALNRLTKKLGALRATLSKDERVLLDRIVLSTPDVSGHKMVNAASGSKKALKANEVAAHSMTTAASGATTAALKASKASEVALHSMTTGAATGATTAALKAAGAVSAASNAAATGAVFAIDATTGGYRVNDGATI